MIDHETIATMSEMLNTTLDVKLSPVLEEIKSLKADVGTLKADVGTLKADVGTLKADVGTLKDDVGTLKANVGTLKTNVKNLQTDVRCIKLDNENIIKPQLNLLIENYLPAAIRFEKTTNEIESMKSDIEIIKKVVTVHSEKLQQIS